MKNKVYLFHFWNNKFDGKTREEIKPKEVKVIEPIVKSFCETWRSLGFEIAECVVPEGGIYSHEDVEQMISNIQRVKTPTELQLEAQQKEINELKSLIKGTKEDKLKKQKEPVSDELKEAREAYEAKFDGKKAYHGWDAEKIWSKINE